uniref:Uncharacterized protein n=1 Tax=Daphnia galeata TaxID=27404 RepID=A0A8J2S138_9CRUS|nr:unnamed protein product [Daphnia galeata]
MLSIKDISINDDSEVNKKDIIYSSFPQLTYAYQDFPIHTNKLTPETRLNIDVLGVFKRWVTTNEDMEVIAANYEKLIIDVGNAIEQIGLVVSLQQCQTLISIKGVRVELVEYTGALSYRRFRDSIVTVGKNCPESPEKEKILAWIEHNNEFCDEAVSEP